MTSSWLEQPLFLMSPPRADWTLRGRANFRARSALQVDASAARREWRALADAILDAGGQVLVLPPHPDESLTGMIYTAEAGLIATPSQLDLADRPPTFLLPTMAVPHRTDEADWIARFVVEQLGWHVHRHPSIWEAQGDALYVDASHAILTCGEGQFARTTREGLEARATHIIDHAILLKFIADPWFHGNTFLNVYHAPHQRLVMLCEEALVSGERERLAHWLKEVDIRTGVPSEIVTISAQESLDYATNALQVHRTILAPEGVSERCVSHWQAIGLTVCPLKLSELFVRGGGAPVCLTCRLHGITAQDVPPQLLWERGSAL